MSDGNKLPREFYIYDNLDVLRGMNSESVDFVYLDPPFNSKREYAAPIASEAKGQKFDDTWKWDGTNAQWLGEISHENEALGFIIKGANAANGNGTAAYLSMMGVRLIELERVMKPGGAIFLHCDDTAVHYLKACMDAVFGASQFRNDIIWQRTAGRSDARDQLGRIHDNILFYRKKGKDGTWNEQLMPHDPEYVESTYRNKDELGRYRLSDLTASGPSGGESGKPWRGIDPGKKGNHWRTPTDGGMNDFIIKHKLIAGWPGEYPTVHQRLDALDKAKLIHWPEKKGGMPSLKRYLESTKGTVICDMFLKGDVGLEETRGVHRLEAVEKQKTGWKTQKPTALVERLIRAATNPDDVVLDPFAGCATACIAAEKLGRGWIGIDRDPSAEIIVQSRLEDEVLSTGLFSRDEKSQKVFKTLDDINLKIHNRPPTRTDIDKTKVPEAKGGRGVIPQEIRTWLYGKQQGTCFGCGDEPSFKFFDADHIVPKDDGGGDEVANLQMLCRQCNAMKKTGSMESLWDRLVEEDIIHTEERARLERAFNKVRREINKEIGKKELSWLK